MYFRVHGEEAQQHFLPNISKERTFHSGLQDETFKTPCPSPEVVNKKHVDIRRLMQSVNKCIMADHQKTSEIISSRELYIRSNPGLLATKPQTNYTNPQCWYESKSTKSLFNKLIHQYNDIKAENTFKNTGKVSKVALYVTLPSISGRLPTDMSSKIKSKYQVVPDIATKTNVQRQQEVSVDDINLSDGELHNVSSSSKKGKYNKTERISFQRDNIKSSIDVEKPATKIDLCDHAVLPNIPHRNLTFVLNSLRRRECPHRHKPPEGNKQRSKIPVSSRTHSKSGKPCIVIPKGAECHSPDVVDDDVLKDDMDKNEEHPTPIKQENLPENDWALEQPSSVLIGRNVMQENVQASYFSPVPPSPVTFGREDGALESRGHGSNTPKVVISDENNEHFVYSQDYDDYHVSNQCGIETPKNSQVTSDRSSETYSALSGEYHTPYMTEYLQNSHTFAHIDRYTQLSMRKNMHLHNQRMSTKELMSTRPRSVSQIRCEHKARIIKFNREASKQFGENTEPHDERRRSVQSSVASVIRTRIPTLRSETSSRASSRSASRTQSRASSRASTSHSMQPLDEDKAAELLENIKVDQCTQAATFRSMMLPSGTSLTKAIETKDVHDQQARAHFVYKVPNDGFLQHSTKKDKTTVLNLTLSLPVSGSNRNIHHPLIVVERRSRVFVKPEGSAASAPAGNGAEPQASRKLIMSPVSQSLPEGTQKLKTSSRIPVAVQASDHWQVMDKYKKLEVFADQQQSQTELKPITNIQRPVDSNEQTIRQQSAKKKRVVITSHVYNNTKPNNFEVALPYDGKSDVDLVAKAPTPPKMIVKKKKENTTMSTSLGKQNDNENIIIRIKRKPIDYPKKYPNLQSEGTSIVITTKKTSVNGTNPDTQEHSYI